MSASMLDARPTTMPSPAWDDRALVDACLSGSEAAWAALVDKYARLIFSVPLRFGFSKADAEDIFQAVCVDLIGQLGSVREPGAIGGWLVRVATHKCLRARRTLAREAPTDTALLVAGQATADPTPERIMEDVQQEQLVRRALRQLSDQCRELLQRLFVETPRRPYDDIAREMGIARGSVSFLRGRCLKRLRTALEKRP